MAWRVELFLEGVVSALFGRHFVGAMQAYPDLVPSLATILKCRFGLDILQPLALGWYNSNLDGTARSSAIPAQGRAGQNALTLIVGNSGLLWNRFLSACAQTDSELLRQLHPLNAYVEHSVQTGIKSALPGIPFSSLRIFWSHSRAQLEGGEGFVAMQRMANYSGLAYLDEISHLSYHPVYGPWFSLRCAIVFDDIPYTGPPKPKPLECPLDSHTLDIVGKRLEEAVAMATTRCRSTNSVSTTHPQYEVRESWRLWLAVRDAAAPGHPCRYSDDQILYHYTGDRSILQGFVDKVKSQENQVIKKP